MMRARLTHPLARLTRRHGLRASRRGGRFVGGPARRRGYHPRGGPEGAHAHRAHVPRQARAVATTQARGGQTRRSRGFVRDRGGPHRRAGQAAWRVLPRELDVARPRERRQEGDGDRQPRGGERQRRAAVRERRRAGAAMRLRVDDGRVVQHSSPRSGRHESAGRRARGRLGFGSRRVRRRGVRRGRRNACGGAERTRRPRRGGRRTRR